jgi:hypothetical protein
LTDIKILFISQINMKEFGEFHVLLGLIFGEPKKILYVSSLKLNNTTVRMLSGVWNYKRTQSFECKIYTIKIYIFRHDLHYKKIF